MKLYILFALGLSFTLSGFAKDCGPKPKASNGQLSAYIGCTKKSKRCRSLKDLDGKVFKVDQKTVLGLGVTKASLVPGADSLLDISVDMDAKTSCWFEKLTKENIGKQIALVFNDEVLINPKIAGAIVGGKIQVDLGNRTSKHRAHQICSSIFKNCKLEEIKNMSKTVPSSFNTPDFNRKELNVKFADVRESLFWYSDKYQITVYKTKDLKEGKPYTLPVKQEGSEKGKSVFQGFQEFNHKTKKFVYHNNAIHIPLLGWVAREELVPSNVITKKKSLEGMITSYFVSKKCKKLTIELIEKQLKKKIPKDYFANQEMMYRNAQVGVMSAYGDVEYRTMLKGIMNDLETRTCKQLYGVF